MLRIFLILVLLLIPANTYSVELANQGISTTTVLSGSGEFFTDRADNGTWNVVLEIVDSGIMWTVIYSYADLSVHTNDFITFQGFPYDGYNGDMVVIVTKDQSRGQMFANIVSFDGEIDLHIETPGGPAVISSTYLGGGYQFIISKGMTWNDYNTWESGHGTDQPADCESGGQGATSCSTTGDYGGECSVSCGAGYYACCDAGTFHTFPNCRCRLNNGAK